MAWISTAPAIASESSAAFTLVTMLDQRVDQYAEKQGRGPPHQDPTRTQRDHTDQAPAQRTQ